MTGGGGNDRVEEKEKLGKRENERVWLCFKR